MAGKIPISGSLSFQVKNIENLKAQARALGKDAEQVCQRTVSDFKNRGPGWVAMAVTGVYNIKKKEVLGAKTGAKSIGKLKLAGSDIDNVSLVFEGRPLTPTHFGMKPKSRPRSTVDETGKVVKRARKYTVTAEVFRGQTKALGSDVFLGKNKGTASVTEIPFQRDGKGRLPIKSVKTTSVPQMLGHPKVEPVIMENVTEGLGKRLEHHIAQAQKRRG